jgi:hypothetical protein
MSGSVSKGVKDLYWEILKVVEKLLGTSDQLDTNELERVGWLLFPEKFNGVFAKDEPYDEKKGFSIVNTDNIDEPGEHWMAVADGFKYDSFARHRENLINQPNLPSLGDNEPEQSIHEKNCGQRCLTWLAVYEAVGPERINLL